MQDHGKETVEMMKAVEEQRKVRTSLPEIFFSMALINIQMIDIEYVCLFIAKLQIEPESGRALYSGGCRL